MPQSIRKGKRTHQVLTFVASDPGVWGAATLSRKLQMDQSTLTSVIDRLKGSRFIYIHQRKMYPPDLGIKALDEHLPPA